MPSQTEASDRYADLIPNGTFEKKYSPYDTFLFRSAARPKYAHVSRREGRTDDAFVRSRGMRNASHAPPVHGLTPPVSIPNNPKARAAEWATASSTEVGRL